MKKLTKAGARRDEEGFAEVDELTCSFGTMKS